MQTILASGVGTPDEQRLGGRVAGVLYVIGGVTAPLLPFLPGTSSTHWQVSAACAAVALVWGLLCLTVVDFAEASRAVFFLPGLLALVLISTVVATSGGAESPARFFLMFAVVYAACFYRPADARALIVLSLLASAAPAVYDSAHADGRYYGELIVLSLAYLTLGTAIIEGRKLLVSARQEAQELALHDPLTGLANRRAMLQWLEGRLAGREEDARLGLVLVDLDGFKDVITLHGYQVGDQVLCEAARTLEDCVRSDDLVARLGGDEFAVLVPGTDPDDVGRVGHKVIECMRTINDRVELTGVRLTASVGWVVYPRDADSIDQLVKVADSCLRSAKVGGKDRALSPLDGSAELIPG